jgi:hypothetical protein
MSGMGSVIRGSSALYKGYFNKSRNLRRLTINGYFGNMKICRVETISVIGAFK